MTMLVMEDVWNGIVGVMEVLYSTPSSSNGVQDIVMDIILVLPNATSETLRIIVIACIIMRHKT